jgi:hypothetical protein
MCRLRPFTPFLLAHCNVQRMMNASKSRVGVRDANPQQLCSPLRQQQTSPNASEIKLSLIVVRQDFGEGHRMKATECKDRAMLDNALPYQVAVNLSDGDGDEGTLRRLYCANLNIGPGHESAVIHDIEKYIFCFANLRDANRFRSQFGGNMSGYGPGRLY